MDPNAVAPKTPNIFTCEDCDFKCYKKSEWSRHILTRKHLILTNPNYILTSKTPDANEYECVCGKSYKHSSSLCAHKKRCDHKKTNAETDINDMHMLTNLVLEVVKNNTDLQKQNDDFRVMLLEQNKQMMETFQEVCKNGINNNSNNNNSHNKAFNLQFFLNETCKDAMNISEFVDSLTLQLSDLENVGKLGFVEGMSNIIIENMKLLDISKRPIHCMDTKREVMYLKDQDTWEKTSDDDNKKIRRAIKQIATKNVKNLRLFKEKHPDCINYNSKYSDQYLKLQTESCGGKHPDYENESKIIKRLAKVMAVDKSL
jgi:hypothetical protein